MQPSAVKKTTFIGINKLIFLSLTKKMVVQNNYLCHIKP